MTGSKKMLIIYILDILKKYTDADHPLYLQGIIDKIRTDYGMECERKAIGRSLTELTAFGFDIDYDKGYYLREREFEDSELRLLIDSVLGSRYIPAPQAKELIDKLNGLSSIYFKRKMRHIINVSKLPHTDNKQLFYIIDVLEEAIEKKKQVAFFYNDYCIDKKYHPRRENKDIINPYQMVMANGRYYLIGNFDQYETIVHLRLDRISEIEQLESSSKPMEKTESKSDTLDLPTHMAEHIYMFSGVSIWVRFRINKDTIGEVIDWFGMDIQISDDTDEQYCLVRVRVNEKAMYWWLLQYLNYAEVLEPKSLRDSIKQAVKGAGEKYRVGI